MLECYFLNGYVYEFSTYALRCSEAFTWGWEERLFCILNSSLAGWPAGWPAACSEMFKCQNISVRCRDYHDYLLHTRTCVSMLLAVESLRVRIYRSSVRACVCVFSLSCQSQNQLCTYVTSLLRI